MMMLLWILIPVVLVLVVFLYNGRDRQNPTNSEKPLGILDQRFAKGEISNKEYEEQKRMLNSKN